MIRRVSQSFADASRFAELLAQYEINAVVIDHTRSDHVAATDLLSGLEDWSLVFVEDGHSLYVRRDAAPDVEPFRILGPGYRTGRLLEAHIGEAEVRAELSRIGAQRNTGVIHAWHEGLALLRPFARAGDRAGLRMHQDREERDRAEAAYERISVAANTFPGFTTIELYRAMAALTACEVPVARVALGRALYGGPTREGVLVGLELALRAGDPRERAGALTQLDRLRGHPEHRDDPWLLAIARDIDVRCR